MRDASERSPLCDRWCYIAFGNRETSSNESSSGQSNTGVLSGQRGALSAFIEPQVRTQWSPFLQGRLKNPFALPALNNAGIYDTQQNALDRLLQQNVSTASSDMARRGFLRAEQTPQVAAQGLQAFLPSYLGQVGQNVEQQLTIPEGVRQQEFADAMDAIRQMIALLGSQSSKTTSGSQDISGGRYGLLI